MRIKSSLLVLLALAATSSSFAAGQIIELKNGTKIVGTIQKQEGGKVTIDAELLGTVVVDATALVSAADSSPAAAAVPPTEVKPSAVVTATAPQAPLTPPKGDAGKVTWKRSLSFSGSYNSAAYVQGTIPGSPAGLPIEGAALGLSGKQSALQITGMLLRATPTLALTLTGSVGYAKYEPSGTVVDNWNSEFTFTRILSPKTYVLARSTYKVDKIALIDHSFEQVVGYGFKVIDNERTHLDLIPGLSEVHEEKGTAFDDQWILSVGFLQNLEHAFNERVTLQQRFKYRIGVEDTEVWSINGYLGLNAALTAHVSMNVGLTYVYDNTLGPVSPSLASALAGFGLSPAQIAALRPAKKDTLQLTSGLEFNW
jgi:hypothetical protein